MMLIPHICCPIMTTKDAWRSISILPVATTRGAYESCTPDAWDSKQLNETSEEVALRTQASFFDQEFLLRKKSMGVVKITSSLERSVAQTEEGLVCFGVPSLLHEPSRRLWYEENSEN